MRESARAETLDPASTTSTTSTTLPPAAKAELLVDLSTGRALFGQHEHVLLPPASLTKLLTAMIAEDWLRPGTLIPVSAQAANVYPDRVGMKAGQRWPLAISLRTLLVFSANDAAYALAQRVGGSLEGFEFIMRRAAAQLGMTDRPLLHDPAGLDGTEGISGGNLLSAWDIAVAARDLMANPVLASIVAMRHYRFTGPDRTVYDLDNKNLYFLDTYPGSIGIKTGFTDPAGFCVAEEAVRGGRAMLAVVMDGENSYQTAADLLDQGFAIPVSAEGQDAQLPPRREPEPPRLAPRPTAPPATERHVTLGPVAAAAPAAARPSSAGTDPMVLGGIGAGVFALVAVSAGALRHRRRVRRNPVGAHSRRT
jgi:D-alanyl-D-alanine carboxypeptidase (penicillin-binding protein 5/6)